MTRLRATSCLALLTVLFALGFAAAAQATTGTGMQNPDLAVTVSISPDTAANGDVVTATRTVKNTSAVRRSVTITATLTTPDGRNLSRNRTVVLAPGSSVADSETYTVSPNDPRGTYSLRLDATCRTGTSSATATVAYV